MIRNYAEANGGTNERLIYTAARTHNAMKEYTCQLPQSTSQLQSAFPLRLAVRTDEFSQRLRHNMAANKGDIRDRAIAELEFSGASAEHGAMHQWSILWVFRGRNCSDGPIALLAREIGAFYEAMSSTSKIQHPKTQTTKSEMGVCDVSRWFHHDLKFRVVLTHAPMVRLP